MEKIYYIQKEEKQMGGYTTFCPIVYIDYDKAKKKYLEYVEYEKNSLDYMLSAYEGCDCISIHGSDEWGEIRKNIWLRSEVINK